ncbi:uncharacterized protein LOC123912898 isoform X2 [Trifolium pratense]|uniref:uncharacterized protein LOC123912898 isoform X2 n=1 Tax=Trifolium pratense TaxID=57577 RepID=UPI001E68FFD1|nr:uncharacterized protein LOC123912898 isoform X2 [Trifolium pratense]XP_045819442.1 uncharacterized protein LOC123912898 isoform X2 [Trifolium pratense]
MKRKGRNNILLREKNGQFKFLKQSCDPYLCICQHCLFNENNVMRRGPDGRKNLCNACGLFWTRTGKLKDLSKGRGNLSIDQSDLDPLIDVNVTVLEGEFPVIQNEQGISEDPSKAIAAEGSNNHALYTRDEEKGRLLPKFSERDVKDPSSAEGFTVIFNEARDEKKTGSNPESPGKTATEPHNKPPLDPGKPQSPMKSFTFSETSVTIESLLSFLDKDIPSTSEVDHTSVVGVSQ